MYLYICQTADSYVPNCYATLYTFYRLPGVIIIFIYSSLILHHVHCCSLLCHLLKKMHFYRFRIILSSCQIENIVKIYQKDRNARQCSRLLQSYTHLHLITLHFCSGVEPSHVETYGQEIFIIIVLLFQFCSFKHNKMKGFT